MGEMQEPNEPIIGGLSDTTDSQPENVEVPTPPPAPEPPPTEMADIEREVSAAMASMNNDDLAELCGDVPVDHSPEPGSEAFGRVLTVSDDEIFLEFGPKAQGILPRAQLKEEDGVPEPGSRLEVMIDRLDEASGLFVLHRKGATQRATWENLKRGTIVEGRVTGLIKGGLEVDLNGIRGFMPGSQASLGPMKDISVLLNERVRCEVVEADKRGKNVVLSRRKLLEHEQAEAAKQLKEELEVGQVRKGIVRNITDFGAFVDLGGLEGLIHIRDVSWSTVEKVTDVLSVDQEVVVQVLKIDTKRDRISLGLKQAQPDPWTNVAERFAEGSALKARIVRIADFGAFAEVEPGVEALIPISEMSYTRIPNPASVVSVGDMVDVVIIRFEADKRRMALSMKQAQPDPWSGVLDGFAVQSVIKGRVTRLADFGAFVELTPGVEGLVHISELSENRVKSCADVVKVDQEIEARVLGVDEKERRISLSIKQVKAPLSGPDAVMDSGPEEPPPPPKIRKKPLRGGLSSHFDW